MISIRLGKVLEIIDQREGCTEVKVMVDDRVERAINYDSLTGPVAEGDDVYLNITAVQLGLGTGGYHFVMANCSRREWEESSPGHIMKLRYTPMQLKVLAVEEEASPHRQQIEEFDSLFSTPVVIGTLHSMLPPAAAAIKAAGNFNLKVVYVMTDGAALPLAFSKLVAQLTQHKLIDGTVTVGHAFGGDLEAVNIYTGLIAAKRVLKADIIIVSMGPGIVGTGTRWGFTGIEQGEIINATFVLGGSPVAIPRISFTDPRKRHYGLSHHTIVSLARVALRPAEVPLPEEMDDWKREYLDQQIKSNKLHLKHRFTVVRGREGLELLKRFGIKVTSMGRTVEDDPDFFLAAAAAGLRATQLVEMSSNELG
ncbi:DUF3866 family protein [Calderihabitans maritimus]|uniref:DUF3866 domain-containing protein n=1 Tax=Calderihabitans maritimus TaxID=1246530 RepID=A0A1Z5HQ85_9FIRM|nr:DUF3866 family protein [Calderihabitans maritimus]GAW91674.1 hypothetical protein Daud_1285 [Calderihabitans maritimus]